MYRSPDITVRCGEAAGVGLRTESLWIQHLKNRGQKMLILGNSAVRCGKTAEIGLHAESSMVQPWKLKGFVKNRESRGS